MFRCNQLLALLAEWPGSFTCHCDNTRVERTPNKSQHTKFILDCRSCRDSNSQPVDHESGALPTSKQKAIQARSKKILTRQGTPGTSPRLQQSRRTKAYISSRMKTRGRVTTRTYWGQTRESPGDTRPVSLCKSYNRHQLYHSYGKLGRWHWWVTARTEVRDGYVRLVWAMHWLQHEKNNNNKKTNKQQQQPL